MTNGIVCARAGSERLENKNSLEINGKPLYVHAVDNLEDAWCTPYLYTDISPVHKDVKKYHVKRSASESHSELPLQDSVVSVVKKSKLKGTCVVLMPTNPMIDADVIMKGLRWFYDREATILRTYDWAGRENGMYIFDIESMLYNNYMYDVHTVAMPAPGIEIHTEEDYLWMKGQMA